MSFKVEPSISGHVILVTLAYMEGWAYSCMYGHTVTKNQMLITGFEGSNMGA